MNRQPRMLTLLTQNDASVQIQACAANLAVLKDQGEKTQQRCDPRPPTEIVGNSVVIAAVINGET